MKILFCGPPYLAIHGPGGVLVQLQKTREYLEKIGYQIDLYDPWRPLSNTHYDFVHVFCTNLSTHDLVVRIKELDFKVAASPIVDKRASNLTIRASNAFVNAMPRAHSHLASASAQCRLADVVISRSEDETSKLVDAFRVSPNRIARVPCGVDSHFQDADPSAFIRKHGMKDFVLAVGLIGNPVKNLLRLIRVVAKRRLPAVFIGPVHPTPYAKEFLSIANSLNHVKVLGVVDEAELKSAYAAADTVIMPSMYEGVGLVALEAGLAGAKIVTTQNGGAADYFENRALYVDPKSESSIEKALLQSLARQKDQALKQHILRTFTWEKVAERQADVYRSVLASSS